MKIMGGSMYIVETMHIKSFSFILTGTRITAMSFVNDLHVSMLLTGSGL